MDQHRLKMDPWKHWNVEWKWIESRLAGKSGRFHRVRSPWKPFYNNLKGKSYTGKVIIEIYCCDFPTTSSYSECIMKAGRFCVGG